MKIEQILLFRFLEGGDKKFVIPVYQRDYSWTKKNCHKLWEDILAIDGTVRKDHFLGTVVGVAEGFSDFVIIDGQQRLTTSAIFLIALHNFLKTKSEKNGDELILEKKLLDLLVDPYSDIKDKKIKLKPNKQDREFFNSLFAPEATKKNENQPSNIISNYNFFLQKIGSVSGSISPKILYEKFEKLKIILISLDRANDDPQLIFESLNSTGVDLTSPDLIRNYLLMDLEPKVQENFYEQFWLKIEKFVAERFEVFAQTYLIFKEKKSVRSVDVYDEFKQLAVKNFTNDKEKILKDLLNYAEIFGMIFQTLDETKHKNEKINEGLQKLCDLNFSASAPFLFDLFSDLNAKILSEEVIIKILKILESYVLRKVIADNTTQGLNKFFITLAKEIKKEANWQQNYLEIFSFILANRSGATRFPSDEDFENALVNKEIYKSDIAKFLLGELENHGSACHILIESLQIEHIMPQKIQNEKKWQDDLGENWQEIHKKYLHTLGNLSLASGKKNSEMSNLPKEAKDKIDYQTSKLKLSYKLADEEKWGEKEIVERSKRLTKEAIEIWQYPESSYRKAIPEDEIFDLSSDYQIKGEKPEAVFFGGEIGEIIGKDNQIKIKSWREFLENTCATLYNLSPIHFEEACQTSELKRYFSNDRSALRTALEYSQERFVERNLSATEIIRILKKLCESMGLAPEIVRFELAASKSTLRLEN